MAAAVVAHRGADVVGKVRQRFDELLNRFSGQVRLPGDCLVQVVDVGGMVFVVVNLHRPRVNMRFQGVHRIGQRRQGEGAAQPAWPPEPGLS